MAGSAVNPGASPEAILSLEASRRLTYSTSSSDCSRDKAASTLPNPRLQLEKQSGVTVSEPSLGSGAADPRRTSESLSVWGRCFLGERRIGHTKVSFQVPIHSGIRHHRGDLQIKAQSERAT